MSNSEAVDKWPCVHQEEGSPRRTGAKRYGRHGCTSESEAHREDQEVSVRSLLWGRDNGHHTRPSGHGSILLEQPEILLIVMKGKKNENLQDAARHNTCHFHIQLH